MLLWPRSLRLRLALWFVSVYIAIHLTLGVVWVVFRYDTARRELDRTIRETMAATATRLAAGADPQHEIAAAVRALRLSLGVDRISAQLTDPFGTAIQSGTDLRSDEKPGAASPGPDAAPVVDWIVAREGGTTGGHLEGRRASQRVLAGDRELVLDLIVVPRLVERQVNAALEFLVLGLPIGLIAAAAAGLLIGTRMLVPLEQMTEAANEIMPSEIDHRLDIDSDSTEFAALQERLNAALARLEAGYDAQATFISNIAHELKTPIAILSSEAQVLRTSPPADAAAWEDFRRSVEEEMGRLARLSETFLALARADRRQSLACDTLVFLPDLLIDAIGRLRRVAEDNGITIVPRISGGEWSPEMPGQPELLTAMLENLLRNAIRHSPPGSRVEVEIDQTNDALRLSVRDHGPGIAAEHLDRIFDRFYQAPNTAKSRGTGLGLTIAQAIARLHDGQITARNCPDGGCCFDVLFSLPSADS